MATSDPKAGVEATRVVAVKQTFMTSAESRFRGQVKGAIRHVYEANMAHSLTEDIVKSLFAVNFSIFI